MQITHRRDNRYIFFWIAFEDNLFAGVYVTDDFGNLARVDFGQLAATVANGEH